MNSVNTIFKAFFGNSCGNCFIGGKHELFNNLVGKIAHPALDIFNFVMVSHYNKCFRKLKANTAPFGPAGQQFLSQGLHEIKGRCQIRILTSGHALPVR